MIIAAVRIAAVGIGLLAFVFFYQPRMLYHPDPQILATPEQAGLDYEDVFFSAADGTKLNGWFVPARGQNGVVIYCHGNGGNISYNIETLGIFHALGLSILSFDYRGFGRSEGTPDEAGTYEDAEAAYNYLLEQKKLSPGNIIIMGRSLGGPIAARVARNRPVRGLILESTFSSIEEIGALLYPYLPVRLLSRFKYDTALYVKNARCPVLVVHSKNDDLIPFPEGRKVFSAAPEPKYFLEISGSHNSGFLDSGAIYTKGIADFIFRLPR